MLLNIRDIVTGWLAILIVTLLIIPFAFWGINYYFDGSGNQKVATVNDRPISIVEFQRAYQDYRRQIQNSMGEQMDSLNNEFIKQQTLNRLIKNEVLLQLARENNLQISDEDVVQAIQDLEAFQSDEGKFSQSLYQRGMQRAGMTSSNFEQQMRQQLLLTQLQNAVANTGFVTDADVIRLARIKQQTRDIVYTTIKSQPIYDSIEVTEEDIKSFYEANIEDYQAQPKIKIRYLDLTIDSLTDDISVTDEDLRNYFENNKSSYTVEATRKITQMYIKLDKDPEQARVDKARETMEFIQKKLNEDLSMDEVATQFADRLGPDFEQISLGYTPKGVMAPKLEDKVFAMQEGETSDIIQSQVGMHIVRLDGIREKKTPSLAKVRDEVEADYRQYQAQQLFFEQADRLATVAYENPNTLEVAAEELGMEIQTSDWFTEGGGEGIASEPKIAMAAFSNQVLEQGLNSEAIELGDSRMVVLRKDDYQSAQPLPLAEVREEIVDEIKYTRASEQARKQGQQILQALRDGKSRDEIAADYDNIEWQQAENVTRDDLDVSRSILRTAFGIAAPAGETARYKGDQLGSGDYIVVGVSRVSTPSADAIDVAAQGELRQQLLQGASQNLWQNTVENARANADVNISQQNLDI